MPLTRVLRSRGSTGWVEAHGEVMFAHNGDVTRWMRNFSRTMTRYTSLEAPSNKRPRWAHYGKPLKRTFTSTTKASPGTLMVHSAIGSTAPHAVYVDQGTGVYGGGGPYQAKILPPWTRQSPSLYEHTWKVPKSNGPDGPVYEEVGTVTVKGQRGQHFFDKGLRRAFASEGMLTVEVPGQPNAMRLFPERLANFSGNTPATAGFIAQLQEWRSWRDRAWVDGRVLGLGYNKERRRRELTDVRKSVARRTFGARDASEYFAILAERRAASRVRSQRYRDKKKALAAARQRVEEQRRIELRKRAAEDKALQKAAIRRKYLAEIAAERAEFLAYAQSKYKGAQVDLGHRRKHNGIWAYRLLVFRGGRRTVDAWLPSNFKQSL